MIASNSREQLNLSEYELFLIREASRNRNWLNDYRTLEFGKIENVFFLIDCFSKRSIFILQMKIFKENDKMEMLQTEIVHNAITDELIMKEINYKNIGSSEIYISKIICQIIIYGVSRNVKVVCGSFPLSKIDDEVILVFKRLLFSVYIAAGKVSVNLAL